MYKIWCSRNKPFIYVESFRSYVYDHFRDTICVIFYDTGIEQNLHEFVSKNYKLTKNYLDSFIYHLSILSQLLNTFYIILLTDVSNTLQLIP